jgi:hypothetical protein
VAIFYAVQFGSDFELVDLPIQIFIKLQELLHTRKEGKTNRLIQIDPAFCRSEKRRPRKKEVFKFDVSVKSLR